MVDLDGGKPFVKIITRGHATNHQTVSALRAAMKVDPRTNKNDTNKRETKRNERETKRNETKRTRTETKRKKDEKKRTRVLCTIHTSSLR